MLVSIIILNLNGRNFLSDCLNSLRRQTYKNFEIIVVDNGSSDGSAEFVKDNFPEVKIIENKQNLGFPKPNNQGFEIALGDYIVTLNNDTVVDEKWLEHLVLAAEKDKRIGMCASKILSMSNHRQIDSAGVNICLDGMSRGRGRLEIDNGQYDNEKEILFPSACAALYKREMLEQTGFFDEDFFAYCDDSDLGLRGRLAGWKAILVPDAAVYHYYSGTGGKYSSLKAYLVERNHFWLVVKYFPPELIILFPFFTLWRFLLQAVAALSGRGASSEFFSEHSFFQSLGVIFRAYYDAVKKIKVFYKKRGEIKKQKTISRKEFYRLLFKYRLKFSEIVFKK